MTAVEYIQQEFLKKLTDENYQISFNKIIEQAKVMEEKQNILIYRRGYIDGVGETQLTNSVIKNK